MQSLISKLESTGAAAPWLFLGIFIAASVLIFAAASMIYVAVADLIPGLHKRTELKATLQQVVLIGLGIGSIWLTKLLLGDV